MTRLERRDAGWRWIVGTALVTSLWLLFLESNIKVSFHRGRPIGLGAMIAEFVVAVLFVMRRQPLAVSRSPVAWLGATVGGFGLLCARPGSNPVAGLTPLYAAMQLLGSLLAIAALTVLGRSFGIVAANRGIRSSGPYRFVRHPAYASYLLVLSGYLLENPTSRNMLIVGLVLIAQLVRIEHEERQLDTDPAYADYRRLVRYRLIPFLY
jgi:protein-S-isoprenylcysteine O-methyltransferase Ste14